MKASREQDRNRIIRSKEIDPFRSGGNQTGKRQGNGDLLTRETPLTSASQSQETDAANPESAQSTVTKESRMRGGTANLEIAKIGYTKLWCRRCSGKGELPNEMTTYEYGEAEELLRKTNKNRPEDKRTKFTVCLGCKSRIKGLDDVFQCSRCEYEKGKRMLRFLCLKCATDHVFMWQLESIKDKFRKLPQYRLLAMAQFQQNLQVQGLQLNGQDIITEFVQIIKDAKRECQEKDVSPINTSDYWTRGLLPWQRLSLAMRRLEALMAEKALLKKERAEEKEAR